MMLSGLEIQRCVEEGQIVIDPFDPKNLNPNSYNLSLSEELLEYDNDVLDSHAENPYHIIEIPAEGFMLLPGHLYLGSTKEYTETDGFVPKLDGRSSFARLGMSIHATAGFGDIGFHGNWTLEITVAKKLIIYPGDQVCQIYYSPIMGDFVPYSSKKYQGQQSVTPSKLWMEHQKT